MSRERNEQGAVLVEFALVATLLILLIFGIVEFGRGYNAKTELTGAVREGARAAALGQSSAQADAVTRAAAPGLTLTSVAVTTCPSGGGGNATVVGTYNWTYSIPLFGSGTRTITATGVMRCGG